MRRVTLNIPENRYELFMELIKSLGIEKIQEKETTIESSEIENLPEWQKEEILRRVTAAKDSDYLTWEELRDSLK
ncbi:hypothetical protein [Belliella pelovolcani]|jgi:hypothetical protein|uniref:Addiction module component n=1 Tax=Belliella pelovolcani TaxID=529505 RepID=A0A1N7NHN2_9BACT|nr:hypothetical protein [Belliella pelovolcani]SIS97807.1 hypothetical protein SAMN05421761_11023 [Belliella pelovolcani]